MSDEHTTHEYEDHSDSIPPDQQVVHVYDGIEEINNPLPGWWQWTLYGAIVFAVIYWFDFEVLKVHKSEREKFEAQQAAEVQKQAEAAAAMGSITPELLMSMSKQEPILAQGKELFTSTCAACHRADGGGGIGPNLTDNFWMHGGKPDQIFKTVSDGVPAKGMPTWGPQLGAQKSAAVAAYVLTLKNTNVANGKAPQGDKED